jgi:7-cyano-7-deazaguanine synthase
LKQKRSAVVLVSGGMDSCLTAAIAYQHYNPYFLHMNYRQKTEKRELKAFHEIADYYQVKHRLVVDMPYFGQIGGSSLTDEKIEIARADLARKEIPSSYVPFRNGTLLSIAAGWAEAVGAIRIFIGAVEEDSSGYPDCRDSFFKAFESAINSGTRPETRIKIERPIIHLHKRDIVREALRMQAPLQLTWSCYQNEDTACGVCDSCALRLRGFKEAGVADPIAYAL